MYNVPKNWTLTTIVADTWTALVDEASIVAALIITNPTEASIDVSARLTASGAVIVPETAVASKGMVAMDIRSLAIPVGDGIEVTASVDGAHFIATGVAA